MSSQAWTAIGTMAGVIATLVGVLLMLPKIRAEARQANAEASRTEWRTLRDEIKRLDGELDDVRAGFAKFKVVAHDEKTELEAENRKLRTEVARLKRRVEGLEAVLKVGPITPDMQALLDELDRKTGGKDA